MDVTIETKCGRCGKTEARSLSLDEAQALGAKMDARTELAVNLGHELNSVLSTEHPDIVIARRNANGEYDVQTLDNLCDIPDAKRNRGCLSRVEALMNEVFMVAPAKPKNKKPSAKKKPPRDDNPEESK